MSNDNLARLPLSEKKSAGDVPALGMSLQVDLGMGRVCTLQTFVPSDVPQIDLNTMLDKMTRAGDRQRAHYRLEELHQALREEERKHAQMQEDVATAKSTFNVEQEKRVSEIERQTAVLTNFEAAKLAQRGEGRREQPKLQGADKANVERLSEAVKLAKKAVTDADLQYQADCGNREASLQTHEKAIARIKADIERCKEIEAAGLKE